MVGFLRFLSSEKSSTSSKMWKLVASRFLKFFHFVYTQSNLVEGQVSELQQGGIQLAFFPWYYLFLSGSLNSLCVFYTQWSLVKDSWGDHIISITLRFYIFTSLARGHLSCAPRWSLKYHVISITLRYSISVSLSQSYFKASHYFRLLFAFLLSRPTTCNTIFSASPLCVVWHKVRTQSA